MAEQKQTLSPAEWKLISDYQIALSEKLQEASSRSQHMSEPGDHNIATSKPETGDRVS